MFFSTSFPYFPSHSDPQVAITCVVWSLYVLIDRYVMTEIVVMLMRMVVGSGDCGDHGDHDDAGDFD